MAIKTFHVTSYTASTETDALSASASTEYIVFSIALCNTTASAISVSDFRVTNSSNTKQSIIFNDLTVAAKDTIIFNLNQGLEATDKLRFTAASTGLDITISAHANSTA